MSGETAETNVVRCRCACGKRYRIRHARPDLVVQCPNCNRMIRITEADLRAAGAPVSLTPLQGAAGTMREAIPLAHDELRLAKAGSRPGVTGRVIETAEDLARTVGLTPFASSRPSALADRVPDAEALAALPRRVLWSGFLRDLVASLYLAGRPRNVGALAAITLVCAIPYAVSGVLAQVIGCLVVPLMLIAFAIAAFSTIQFMWHTLTRTAGGDDDIPLFEGQWDWVEDGLKPAFWLAGISLFCVGPALLLAVYAPASAHKQLLVYAAQFAGSFLWPVAVMSVALGESLLFMRPDWLVRCVVGIGPLYVLAWGLVEGAWYAGVFLLEALEPLAAIPMAGPIVYHALYFGLLLYMGYVVFRTMGLLFRHFRHRFPWRF